MTATEVIADNREEVEREIYELEMRISGLRARLPLTTGKFFVFNTDKRKIWIYAVDRDTANDKLRARMNKDYGVGGWKILSKTVTVYSDPQDAANHSPGNVFRALTRQDALQLLQDWQRNQAGREPRPKNLPTSGFEKDAEAFEMKLRIEANNAGR